MCRIFTRSSDRQAPEAELEEFREKVASSTVAVDLGGVKKSDLPGKEFLHTPGKKNGQTAMVRDGEKVLCYSWNSSKFEWEAVGEVVGGAGGSAGTSGKVLYQGREYDYVFDVDLDGENTLKLPYNCSEDPWYVAQKFIHQHDLPQTYLDQVANFIITNANVNVSAQSSGYQDPFTGGARYVPGSGSSFGTGGQDPFTGGGRYVPPQEQGSSSSTPQSNFFPQLIPLRFESCNTEGILNKFSESNKFMESNLTEEQLKDVVMSAASENTDPLLLAPLETALQWPPDRVWPALDVLRLALKSFKIQEAWIKNGKGESILNLLIDLVKPQSPVPAQLLALRCISNLAAHPPGQKVLLNSRDVVVSNTVNISPYPNKNVEIAASTVLLNYSVILPNNCYAEQLVQVVSAISTIMISAKESEAQFRSLVALGTILTKIDSDGKSLAASLDIKPLVIKLSGINDPAKVGECARHVLRFL